MSLSGLRIQVYLDLSTFEKYRKLRSLSSQLYSDFVNWSQPKYQIASTSFANMPDIILALIFPNAKQYCRHPHVIIPTYKTAYTWVLSCQPTPTLNKMPVSCISFTNMVSSLLSKIWDKLIWHDHKWYLILIKILIKLPLMLSFFEGYIQCWWAINQS